MKKALIIVDVQNDFLPGGALSVPRGHEVVPFINRLMQLPFDVIVATSDWHPKDHVSFAAHWKKNVGDHVVVDGIDQILWPDHCVAASWGAEFSRDLDTSLFHKVFHKGTDPGIDSYSAFFDNEKKKSTGLESYLRENECEELYFAGLATEYCVLFSVRDAVHLGFKTSVIRDACRGIDLVPGDEENAIGEMKALGAFVRTTVEVESAFAIRLIGS